MSLVAFYTFLSFPLVFLLQGEVLRDAAKRDRSPEVLPGQRGMYTTSNNMMGSLKL